MAAVNPRSLAVSSTVLPAGAEELPGCACRGAITTLKSSIGWSSSWSPPIPTCQKSCATTTLIQSRRPRADAARSINSRPARAGPELSIEISTYARSMGAVVAGVRLARIARDYLLAALVTNAACRCGRGRVSRAGQAPGAPEKETPTLIAGSIEDAEAGEAAAGSADTWARRASRPAPRRQPSTSSPQPDRARRKGEIDPSLAGFRDQASH